MSLQVIKIKKSTNSGIASATAALAANPARISYFVQNLGLNPLFVKEGASASTSDFTYVLAAGSTTNDNGTGGSKECGGDNVWVGAISIAGTSPRYTITERVENT